MKLRKLIERKSVVAERVNLEASRKPDARDLFLQARLRREQEAQAAIFDEIESASVDPFNERPLPEPKAELVEVVEKLKRGGPVGR